MLLKIVEQTSGGMRHAEISRRLRIPKSTCSYILTRLEREGYVFRDQETARYRIGLATLALAQVRYARPAFIPRRSPPYIG